MSGLEAFADAPRWVAWRNESRDGKLTKVPFAGENRRARADDPKTWRPRRQAEICACRIVNGAGGGIGIVLGNLDDGRALIGVDLDTCRDAAGDFAPWAAEVIERFGSYAEISPSGSGAKIFALADAATVVQIRAAIGQKHGRTFARRGGTAHPPAIEVHLSNRYFAVTGQRIATAPADLATVPAGTLLWLLTEHGPAFAGASRGETSGRDNSRSADAFRLGADLRRAGQTFEEFRKAVREDRRTNDWYREKGTAHDERELHRIWEKVARDDADVTAPTIDPKAPYDVAHSLLNLHFDADGMRTLHRHRGAFYVWDGSAYPPADDEDLKARVYAFLDQCRALDRQGEPRLVKPNMRLVGNVLDALAAAAQLDCAVSAPAWLDGTKGTPAAEIFSCANGLLHVPTGMLLPHTPVFFTQNSVDYAFDPTAPDPAVWLGFLHELWPEDGAAIGTLQEIFGYFLGADTSQQKLFLIVGPRRSGKGTIARVLAGVIGPDNRVGPTLAAIGTNFGLAPLIGKRLAVISDARLGGRADQHAIAERLLSISGEDAITIDRKHREAWTGRLQVRFLILSNELPRLADASGALSGRFVVLVQTRSFYGREDRSLEARLLPERPAILNWAIAGWRRLTERGYFVNPASSTEALRDLEDLGSPIGAFVRECCAVGAGCRVPIDDLFDAWCRWCQRQRRDHPGSAQTFGRDLRTIVPGLRVTQPREGNGRARYYEGIGLR